MQATKYFIQVMSLYKDVNIENTLKLLIRSQKLLKAKETLIQIFKQIPIREEISQKFKSILELCHDSSIDPNSQKSISEDSAAFFKLSHQICEKISKLGSDCKIFNQILFVFDGKLYSKYVKSEVIGVKRIISLNPKHS